MGQFDHPGDFRHVRRCFRRGGELLARPVDALRHFEGVGLSCRRLSDGAQSSLKLDAKPHKIKHALARGVRGDVFLALRVPGVVPHLALRPGHQIEGASGLVPALVHQAFLRHDMATVAVRRQLVERVPPDHPLRFGKLPARRLLRLGLGLRCLAAEPAMDLDPILGSAVAGFAGDAGDNLLPAVFLPHGEMAIQAHALRLDASQPHLFRYLLCLGFARHFTEGLEVMRAFPGLCLLLVAFGAGIRPYDLGRIGHSFPVRGKAEEHEPTAETKHVKPAGGAEPEPGRPKAMHFESDIHVLLLLQPSRKL